MKKILATALLLFCMAGSSKAETYNLMGEQHNVTISSATQLSCPGASYAAVQVTGDGAYWTVNTSTPSSTNGFFLSQNSTVPIIGTILVTNFKIIQVSSASKLQYFCARSESNK